MRTVLPSVRALSPSDAIGFDPEPPVEASKQPTLCCWFRQHFTFAFSLYLAQLHPPPPRYSDNALYQSLPSKVHIHMLASWRWCSTGEARQRSADPCSVHAAVVGARTHTRCCVVCTLCAPGCRACVHVCTPAWVNWAQCQCMAQLR